ncbi:MAG: hypothetical protein ABSD64_12750 [Terriglobales bacterium]|jgi:hypothetical protein
MKMNGDRCGSPAQRDQKFCYFHNCCGPVKVDVSISAAYPATPFYLPILEDAASIQYTIAQVCEHLLHHRLDAKNAGVMLYAMQIASSNLARLGEDESEDESQKKSGAPGVPARPTGSSIQNQEAEPATATPRHTQA